MRLVLSLIAAALVLNFGQSSSAQQSEAVPVSQSAEGIYTLGATALNEAPSFASYSGNITLVVLFQPGCPWCAIQFRDIEELKRDRAPWLQVAAVSRNGSVPALLRELEEYRTSIPAYQSSRELLSALQYTPGTPCVYLISPDGRLGQVACGRMTADQLVGFLTGR